MERRDDCAVNITIPKPETNCQTRLAMVKSDQQVLSSPWFFLDDWLHHLQAPEDSLIPE
jgi:hypothetical protein